MDFESNKEIIERIIHKIEREYRNVKGLILTEDDLKCLIYCNLMMIRSLSDPQHTREDNVLAHSNHTELSWFDDQGKLTIKPDLTILEPNHLSILKLTNIIFVYIHLVKIHALKKCYIHNSSPAYFSLQIKH